MKMIFAVILTIFICSTNAQTTTSTPTTAATTSASTTGSSSSSSTCSAFSQYPDLFPPDPTYACPQPAFNPLVTANNVSRFIACNLGPDGVTQGYDCTQTGYLYNCQTDNGPGCPGADANNQTTGYLNGDICNYGSNFVANGLKLKYAVPTPLCLVLGGGYSPTGNQADISTVLKSYWYPTVDNFTMISLRQSYSFNHNYGFDCASRLVLSYGPGITSTPKRRFGFSTHDGAAGALCSMVVPYVAVVIQVSQGVVTGFQWDEDCSTCSGEACIDGFCSVPARECSLWYGNPANAVANCDIQIYIAWSGTDANGYYFTSDQQKISNFRRFSFQGAINAASSVLPSTLPQVDTGSSDPNQQDPRNYR